MMHKTPEVVCFGEALADCFPDRTVIGGAPLNVARHLSLLGCRSHVMTALGNDTLGERILDVCRSDSVQTGLISISTQASTGQVRVDTTADGGHTFHIEPDSAWDYIEPTPQTGMTLAHADCLVYGTLAMRSPGNRKTFLSLINDFGGLLVCDFNWRGGHLPLADAVDLARKARWLKINDQELHMLLGFFKAKQIEDVVTAMSVELCLLTKGAEGYAVYSPAGLLFEGESSPIHSMADTVGAGDSFLACALAACLQGVSLEQALKIAAKFAAGICGIRGAVPEDREFHHPFHSEIRLLAGSTPFPTGFQT